MIFASRMRLAFLQILFLGQFFCSSFTWAASPVDKAVYDSGAVITDSNLAKVALLLHLLNDSPYLAESSPDPQFAGHARFTTTPEKQAYQLLEHYRKDSSGGPYAPYDLDSDRTPEEMLAQRIGGSCGTRARVFARLLEQLGVNPNNLRIVSAVCTDEYDRFCPGRNSKLDHSYRGGASGHVFVLMKLKGKWKLINTTYPPFSEKKGPNAQKIRTVLKMRDSVKSKEQFDQYRNKAVETIRNLSVEDLEIADFPSPKNIEHDLRVGKTVKIPEFDSLPETLPGGGGPIHFRKMIVYDVSKPDSYLLHKWKDRLNMIASGNKESDICRFNTSTGF